MFVYFDESGDTGFKFEKGSSAYFIAGLVNVTDPEQIESRVSAFRQQNRLRETFEFKFYKMDNRRRTEFLRCVSTLPVAFHLMVVDKRLLARQYHDERDGLYGVLMKMLLENAMHSISNATLIIDESSKSKRSQQALATYLKRQLQREKNDACFREIKYADSRTAASLQIADALVGAAMRAYRDGDPTYLDLVRKQIQAEWVWRPFDNQ